jgi:ABC-type antimicrobial peptide transport system permease subunit
LEEQVALSLAQERMIAGLLAAFAALALVLAAVGLYGVISYTTQIRTKKFGVRLTLSALPTDMLRLVVGQGTRLALVGIVFGLAVAAMASRALSTLLFGADRCADDRLDRRRAAARGRGGARDSGAARGASERGADVKVRVSEGSGGIGSPHRTGAAIPFHVSGRVFRAVFRLAGPFFWGGRAARSVCRMGLAADTSVGQP